MPSLGQPVACKASERWEIDNSPIGRYNGDGALSRKEAGVAERSERQRRPKKPRPKAWIDPDGCSGCMVCVSVCPVDCIYKVGEELYPNFRYAVCWVDPETCTGCNICYQDCPWECIYMLLPGEHPDLPAEVEEEEVAVP